MTKEKDTKKVIDEYIDLLFKPLEEKYCKNTKKN